MKKDNRKTNILVVDDEPLIQDMLRTSLEARGYKVAIAHNGLEALNVMAGHDFGLVFMDLRMPVMDGLSAVKFLRQCEQGEHHSLTEQPYDLAQSLHSRRKGTRMPVVALTGNIGDREIVLQAGMDEHIAKPFPLSKIYDTVDRYCGNSAKCSPAERRRHPRCVVKNDTVIVSDGYTGQVVDISPGGLAIKYPVQASLPDEWRATVFNITKNISTPSLPLKLARRGEIGLSPASGEKTRIIGAMFHDADTNQQDQIQQFIYFVS